MTLDDVIARVCSQVVEATGCPYPLQVGAGSSTTLSTDVVLARYIDHTLLKAESTPLQIEQLCHEARQYGFASVCVNPSYVAQCIQLLDGSSIPVCTVVGFPLGATTTEVKVFETHQSLSTGAREIDMVLAIGHLKAGSYAIVLDDLRQVVAACHASGALCKVIIETALLSDEEKIAACILSMQGGADFVKTSTGFAARGATVQDVQLIRRVIGPTPGVKASGGIRTRETAQAMLAAGATRIGTSSSIEIIAA